MDLGRTLRESRERLVSTDIALVAAGLTFYSAIAVVPILLLGLWVDSVFTSEEHVLSLARDVSLLIPDAAGARVVVTDLAQSGVGLGLLGAAICIFPATFYGEGFRRALLRFTATDDSHSGYRGRIAALPVLIMTPLLMYVVAAAGSWMFSTTNGGGFAAIAFRVWFGLVVLWLVLALPIGWTFRVVAPIRPSWRAVVIGALTTSSFVAGFLQGFVLFLAIPWDLGRPFGGLTVIGAIIAIGFWLWLLHIVVLAGWALTLQLSTSSE